MVISVYPEVGQMNYTVNETDTVTFECPATGIPPPTITCLRNGRELNDMTDFHVSVSIPIEIDFRRDNDGETVVLVTRSLDLQMLLIVIQEHIPVWQRMMLILVAILS